MGQGLLNFQCGASALCYLLCGSFTVQAKRGPNTKLPAATWSARHPEGASSRAEKMTVQIAVWPETCHYLHFEKAIYLGGSSCQGFTLLHLDRSCLAYGPSHSQSFGFSHGKTLGVEAFAESMVRPRKARTQFYVREFQAQSVIGKQSLPLSKAGTAPTHPLTPQSPERREAWQSPTSQQKSPYSRCKNR